MGALQLSGYHRAYAGATLTLSGNHRGFATAVCSLSGYHRADSTPNISLRGYHRAAAGKSAQFSGSHVAVAREPAPFVPLVPLDPVPGTPYYPADPGSVPGLFNINLLTGFYRPWIRVLGKPSGAKLIDAQLSHAVNGGWKGNLVFHGLHAIDFDEWQTMRIVSGDGNGGVLESPAMIAESRRRAEGFGGPTTSFALIDETSYKLSRGGRNLPTFVRATCRQICDGIAQEWGLSAGIRNAPDFNVLEEDIKNSNGWDALLRIAAVSADNLIIDRSGAITFVHNQQRSNRLRFRVSDIEQSFTPSKVYTGFAAVKTSSILDGGTQEYTFTQAGYASFQLRSPLRNPMGSAAGGSGGLGYLGFWSGAPGSPDSRLVRFQLLGQPEVGISLGLYPNEIATHCTVRVFANSTLPSAAVNVRLLVSGATPEPALEGTERAFFVRTGLDDERGMKLWREQMLPSKAYVEARISRYLWEASKPARPLNYSGRLDYDMQVCTELVRTGYPANRAEEVTHSWSGAYPTTSVSAVLI